MKRIPISRTRSIVETTVEVDEFAQANNIARDISIVGEVCVRHVPRVRLVLVTLKSDFDDEGLTINFGIATAATVDEVLASRRAMQAEYFRRVSPQARSLITFGYNFIN